MRLLIIILVCISRACLAQPPDTLWTRTYGGNAFDEARSVQVTHDGGFIFAGGTWSYGAGSQDIYIVKLDSLGNEEWSRTYGTEYSESAHKILVLADGYLAAGYYSSWPPFPPEPSTGWLLRLDNNGDTLWTKRCGFNQGFSWFLDIIQTQDGGFVGTGFSYPAGNYQTWIMRFNQNGDSLWNRSYGGPGREQGFKVDATPDGGFVVAGVTTSYGAGYDDIWLLKVDASGDSLWSRTFGGPSYEGASALTATPDGGFLLGGYTASLGISYDNAWLVKTDSFGNYEWDTVIEGYSSDYALYINAVSVADSGAYYAAGRFETTTEISEGWFVKFDSRGDSLWTLRWPRSDLNYFEDLTSIPGGGFMLAGIADYEHNDSTGDAWLVRLTPEAMPVGDEFKPVAEAYGLNVYPNPVNGVATISLSVPRQVKSDIHLYDVLGRQIAVFSTGILHPGGQQFQMDMSHYPSGKYFLSVCIDEQYQNVPLIVLR